jgi:hypothetical protein
MEAVLNASRTASSATRTTSVVSAQTLEDERRFPAVKSVRVLANLLSFPSNRSEIQRLIPSVYEGMLCCQNPRSPPDLLEASKCVVQLLHDNPDEMHTELMNALANGSPDRTR